MDYVVIKHLVHYILLLAPMSVLNAIKCTTTKQIQLPFSSILSFIYFKFLFYFFVCLFLFFLRFSQLKKNTL